MNSNNSEGSIVRYAFFSLTDKSDVESYAQRLVSLGWNIISAGNTYKKLVAGGIPVTDLSGIVGGGPIMGHKVMTLSRELAMSLLADSLKPEEMAELISKHLPFIDLLYINFYDAPKAIAEAAKLSREEAIAKVVEGSDIGGPNGVREAAKGNRIVICRKQDVEPVLLELESIGDVSAEHRQELRARAEFEVSKYVGQLAQFHGFGQFKAMFGERVFGFKGENGSQSPAGLYTTGSDDPLALDRFQLIEGSAPSYNNWCDVDRLLQTLTHIGAAWKLNFDESPNIVVGCKHGNACGASVGEFDRAIAASVAIWCDDRAIFGGLLMTNFLITEEIALAMAEAMPNGKAMFDGVIASNITHSAVQVLSRVKGKCRLMVNQALSHGRSALLDKAPRFRYGRGVFLAQPNYEYLLDFSDPDMKFYGKPLDEKTMKDLLLAHCICCTSNSNTITLVRNGALIGNGVGQQDRVGAAELAIKRALDATHGYRKTWTDWFRACPKALEGSVACSDSFFPFPDGVQVLIDAGVKAIFSTSGSINDSKVLNLCLENGISLVQLPDSKARGFFGH